MSTESISFAHAVNAVQEINRVLVDQLVSPEVASRLNSQKDDFRAFDEGHFFEIVCDIPSDLDDTQCICARTYFKEMCIILIYLEGIFYCVLGDSKEEQPLLDVEFPDISQEGRGLLLALNDKHTPKHNYLPQWRKLSLWEACSTKEIVSSPPRLISLSAPSYQQTYCILTKESAESHTDDSFRNVLFRFGSWCYNGEIELIPQLSIHDIPHVIPTLRIQQHKLSFLSDISELREDCVFTDPLLYTADLNAKMEKEILSVESIISDMNLVDDDTDSYFFEFTLALNRDTQLHRNDVDLIATKSHHSNGLVVCHIYFDGAFYVAISGRSGDQLLLDSHFPCVVGHGIGEKLKSYPTGLPGWSEVRKLSLWKNASSALDTEEGNQDLGDHIHTNDRDDIGQEIFFENDLSVEDENHDKANEKVYHVMHSEEKSAKEHFYLKTLNDGDACERGKTSKSNPDTTKEDHLKGEKVRSDRIFTFHSSRKGKRNLGVFHHLAPLQKVSMLEDAMKENRSSLESSPPWDANGRPIER